MKVKYIINNNKNKLLKLKFIKINIYKKKSIITDLKNIQLKLKRSIQITYKHQINNKKILFTNKLLNNLFKHSNYNAIYNSLNIIIGNSLIKNKFLKVPTICIKSVLNLIKFNDNIDFKITELFCLLNKKRIINNFLNFVFNINYEFKKK